jgi:hypothetical protein
LRLLAYVARIFPSYAICDVAQVGKLQHLKSIPLTMQGWPFSATEPGSVNRIEFNPC